jgi:hypothetical protein
VASPISHHHSHLQICMSMSTIPHGRPSSLTSNSINRHRLHKCINNKSDHTFVQTKCNILSINLIKITFVFVFLIFLYWPSLPCPILFSPNPKFVLNLKAKIYLGYFGNEWQLKLLGNPRERGATQNDLFRSFFFRIFPDIMLILIYSFFHSHSPSILPQYCLKM